MTEIEVLKIKLMNGNCNPLKAVVSLRVGELIIHDWRIIKRKEERAWIEVPQSTWVGSDGVLKYRHIMVVPRDLKQRIDVAILAAWEREELNEKGNEGK